MITDKMENIIKYSEIPEDAAKFIKNLHKELKVGQYKLENENYANVESYFTKSMSEAKFESHKKYCDIQLLLSGKERIYITPIDNLTELGKYNETKDIVFYAEALDGSDFVTLDSTNFVLLYPNEAHAPQVSICDAKNEVKKVVIKIKI